MKFVKIMKERIGVPKFHSTLFPNSSSGLLVASIAMVCAISSASALTFSISSSAPTPSPTDVYNLTGASNDAGNVNDGGTYADGVGNDAFTYVSGDRPAQGQTFTTGANPQGYTLKSIWVRHAGYTSNTAQTYWRIRENLNLTMRLTDPSHAGSGSFVVLAETYQTNGLEGWSEGLHSPEGSGAWLKFTFNDPITLRPNQIYGFDLSSSSREACFEWLGISTDVFTGGGAYRGSAKGGADTVFNALIGDRVFLVELAPAGSNSAGPGRATQATFSSTAVPPMVEEDASDSVVLSAADGVITGKTAKLTRSRENNLAPLIEAWSNPADSVRWNAKVLTPGIFDVLLEYAVVGTGPGSRVEVAVGPQGAQAQLDPTPDWGTYRIHYIGQVEITQAGVIPVSLNVLEKHGEWVMNFRSIRLRRSQATALQDPPIAATHPALP